MGAILSNEEVKSFLQSKRHLLSTPNVVSLGFSDEIVDGRETGGKIFRVGVIKRLPKASIDHPNVFIPKFYEHTQNSSGEKVNIPVKIVEEGELVFIADNGQVAQGDPQNEPPYEGASLIRSGNLRAIGCLGANVEFRGGYRLLSAAHVLTKFDNSNIENQILVQNMQGQWVQIGATVTGQVHVDLYTTPNELQPEYARQDLAWADITPDIGSPKIMSIGEPESIRQIIEGERVKYYGGMSDDFEQNVKVEDVRALVKMRMETHSGETKYCYFEDICRIEHAASLLDEGDSGSAIVAESDNALLGILMMKSPRPLGTYYFCKLIL